LRWPPAPSIERYFFGETGFKILSSGEGVDAVAEGIPETVEQSPAVQTFDQAAGLDFHHRVCLSPNGAAHRGIA